MQLADDALGRARIVNGRAVRGAAVARDPHFELVKGRDLEGRVPFSAGRKIKRHERVRTVVDHVGARNAPQPEEVRANELQRVRVKDGRHPVGLHARLCYPHLVLKVRRQLERRVPERTRGESKGSKRVLAAVQDERRNAPDGKQRLRDCRQRVGRVHVAAVGVLSVLRYPHLLLKVRRQLERRVPETARGESKGFKGVLAEEGDRVRRNPVRRCSGRLPRDEFGGRQ